MNRDTELKLTMRQMCEHIVKANIFKHKLTAEEIFNYSPTGELGMVFQWFELACQIIGNPEIENQ